MDDDTDLHEELPADRKRTTRWLIVALVAAVLAGVLLASSVWDNRWSSGNAVGNTTAQAGKEANPDALCAAQATYDAMRRELFRRAAQVRGSDEQAYTRLADFALLRVNGPVVRGVDDQLHSVTCSGNAVLSLPPGVAVAGGRTSLSADVDYMVQPAADGTGNVVKLGNADGIVVPLATLERKNAPQSAPLVPPELQNQTAPVQTLPAVTPAVPPTAGEGTAPSANANPSFDCNDAHSRSEIAICNDSGLAALDRQMAGQYNAALSRADSDQRKLLDKTLGRFLTYRDRCATNQCIAQTYRSRMREISDIMADRWQG